ncbi:hypothetical protein AB0N05_35215 [Nocardia sp. NPDC051030]|uniref:hypothetical protein n=1 Tax=Nocardia sp. NPDC051030 TaxID=3155162 RepID=UPI003437275D
MNAGAFVARNAKTVVSLIGGLINVIAVATLLVQYAPPEVAGVGTALATAAEVLRSINVWIVRNEPLLETAAEIGTELVNSVQSAADSTGASPTLHGGA